ncbi:hypothetical protein C7M84_025515 [Penaeus vannamei]|uniref:Sushi domain-containing protein n=1 Tax=Penaeus vannamei TaxID=6689 RepID=A0A3R7SYG5_PENVA|nr:hypothetical protein C7M84_025515 [Penaeus vannamei]
MLISLISPSFLPLILIFPPSSPSPSPPFLTSPPSPAAEILLYPCPQRALLWLRGMELQPLDGDVMLLSCLDPKDVDGARVMMCAGEDFRFPFACEGWVGVEHHCTADPPQPNNTVIKYKWEIPVLMSTPRKTAILYECKPMYRWASGWSVRHTQCEKASWTPVEDTCVEDVSTAGAACLERPPLPPGAKEKESIVINGTERGILYECDDGLSWSDARELQAAQCVGGTWTAVEESCISEEACPTPSAWPPRAVANRSFIISGVEAAVMYTCEPGYEWASGQLVLFSQCVDGNWTLINDSCQPEPASPSTPAVVCYEDPHPPCFARAAETWKEGGFKVAIMYICDDGFKWWSRQQIQASHCINGSWTPVDDNCIPDESELSPCQFEPPANAVLVRRDPRRCTEIPAVIGYYECAEGYSWLSGAQYHEAHCIGRLWKPILDLCVADCGALPRDCSDIASLGFEDSDIFRVFSSGSLTDLPTMVTIINIKYWRALLNLSRDMAGARRPLVFQFLMTLDGVLWHHATFGPVILGDDLMIEELGEYHGNAGNAFWEGENSTNFEALSNWWRNMQHLGEEGNTLHWPPLENGNRSLQKAMLRFRPAEFDSAISCPPLVGFWPNTSYVSIPLSRAPGQTITQACWPLVQTMTCTCNLNGSPTWEGSIDPDCSVDCPDYFIKSRDGHRCYNVSSGGDAHGFLGAAQRCAEMNASLAIFYDAEDLDDVIPDGRPYYTMHRARGYIITPDIPAYTPCLQSPCWPTRDKKCIVVDRIGTYAAHSCFDEEIGYVCMTPGESLVWRAAGTERRTLLQTFC